MKLFIIFIMVLYAIGCVMPVVRLSKNRYRENLKPYIKEDKLEATVKQSIMQDRFTVGTFIPLLVWAIWVLI